MGKHLNIFCIIMTYHPHTCQYNTIMLKYYENLIISNIEAYLGEAIKYTYKTCHVNARLKYKLCLVKILYGKSSRQFDMKFW